MANVNLLTDVHIPDDTKLTFGDSSSPDIEIYYDSAGTDTGKYISGPSTGTFYIQNEGQNDVRIRCQGSSGGANNSTLFVTSTGFTFSTDSSTTVQMNDTGLVFPDTLTAITKHKNGTDGSLPFKYKNTSNSTTTTTAELYKDKFKFHQDIELDADLIDINGNTGTAGQVLSSLGTGNGVDWIDASSGTISGSGTANTVTKFTGTSAIGDGPITFSSNDSTFAGHVTLASDFKVNFGASTNIEGATSGTKMILTTSDDYLFRFSGTTKVSFESNGAVNFIGYGGGSITGTGAKALQVTSGGKIIEADITSGTVTSVGATAPVTSTGGTTPTIGVDTAAVSSASSKLATGAQIQTAIDSAVSGTTNTIAKFTGSNVVGNSEISDTGSVIKLGLDASSQETLYLDTVNRKVGFRTQSPGSAFDVNGTMRVRNQLNVGNTTEQNLYVDGNGAAGGKYVKMGNYGVPGGASPDNGNYFGITGTENQPKYCAAFGNAGKIVQDMRIITIKLSGDAFKLLSTTGTTLIPAPGANSLIIPYECLIHNTGGSVGSWGASSTAAIGFCAGAGTCNYPAQMNRLFVINNQLLKTVGAWYYAVGIATTGVAMTLNKPLLLKASDNLTTVPAGTWYIQIRYQIMNKDSGLIQNVDITKTTN